MHDGYKQESTMLHVYGDVHLMQDHVEYAAGKKSCKGYLEVIDTMWDGMLSLPLHKDGNIIIFESFYTCNLVDLFCGFMI